MVDFGGPAHLRLGTLSKLRGPRDHLTLIPGRLLAGDDAVTIEIAVDERFHALRSLGRTETLKVALLIQPRDHTIGVRIEHAEDGCRLLGERPDPRSRGKQPSDDLVQLERVRLLCRRRATGDDDHQGKSSTAGHAQHSQDELPVFAIGSFRTRVQPPR